MNFGRVCRTVRHLTAEQWLYRVIRRGERLALRARPGDARARVARRARALPLPDTARPEILAIAETVLGLQQAVHGDHLDGIAAGRFHLLNREIDFGGLGGIEWRRDFGDGNNPLWRMTLGYMGYAVPMLASGAPEALGRVRMILAGLVAQNDWRRAGVFRDVWNPYTASHRLINLLSGLALFRAAGGHEPVAEAEILDHVRFCAVHIRGHLERELQYNHLSKNYAALAAFGAGFDAPPASLDFLRREVPASLRQQVLGDGGHAERAPMYHLLFLLDLRLFRASRLFASEWGPMLNDAIARMESALAAMTHPDGDIALFNDSWLGEAPKARAALGGAMPSSGRLVLGETGYVRLGGDAGDAVIFDCGPCGPDANPGHAHADFLSVELSVAGRRFIVDPGVPTYTAGIARDSSRSAAAHNGPHVGGAEPIEFWKSFRVGRRGSAGLIEESDLDGIAPLWCAGWQDGYARHGIRLRRWVGLWPGRGAMIVDLATGGADRVIESHFLVAGDWRVEGAGGLAFVGDGSRVALDAARGALTAPETASHWPRFGVAREAHSVRLRPESINDTRLSALDLVWGEAPVVAPESLARLAAALERH